MVTTVRYTALFAAVAAVLMVAMAHAEDNESKIIAEVDLNDTTCLEARFAFHSHGCAQSPCRDICERYLPVMSSKCTNETTKSHGRHTLVSDQAKTFISNCKRPCYRSMFKLKDHDCLQQPKWCSDEYCLGVMHEMASDDCRADDMVLGSGRLREPAWLFMQNACSPCSERARASVRDKCDAAPCKEGCQETARFLSNSCSNTTFVLDGTARSVEEFGKSLQNEICPGYKASDPPARSQPSTSSQPPAMDASSTSSSSSSKFSSAAVAVAEPTSALLLVLLALCSAASA